MLTLKSGLISGFSSHPSFKTILTKSMQLSRSSSGGWKDCERSRFKISCVFKPCEFPNGPFLPCISYKMMAKLQGGKLEAGVI